MDLYDTSKRRLAAKVLNDELADAQRPRRPAEQFAEKLSVSASNQMQEPRTQKPEPEKIQEPIITEPERMGVYPAGSHLQGAPTLGGGVHIPNSRARKAGTPENANALLDLHDRADKDLNAAWARKTPEQRQEVVNALLARKREAELRDDR